MSFSPSDRQFSIMERDPARGCQRSLGVALCLLGWLIGGFPADKDARGEAIIQTGYSNQGFAVFPVSAGTTGDPYAGSRPLASESGDGLFASLRQTGFRTTRLGNPGWLPSLGGLPSLESLTRSGPIRTPRLWMQTDYLYWWTEGMNTPPLVTTSPNGTAQNQAGILGFAGTRVLFGNEKINDGGTSGVRFRGGFFLTPQAAFGIETEAFTLAEKDDGFRSSTGREIVARPFFDINGGRETAQLIDFPNLVDGSLSINSSSELRSFMLAGRASLCPTCSGGTCMTCQSNDRIDWIVGYRHVRLEESLTFSESLDSLVVAAPGNVSTRESFATKNRFNGLQLGIAYQANLNRVWLASMLRVAVGNYQQSVDIRGATSITEFGVTDNYDGGLLAQPTNSGSFDRDNFTMIPELGVTLGIRMTNSLHGTIGYNLLYMPSVLRPGDQLETDVNPNLLAPPVNPLVGALRPRFQFVESDYWAQGLTLGGQLRY